MQYILIQYKQRYFVLSVLFHRFEGWFCFGGVLYPELDKLKDSFVLHLCMHNLNGDISIALTITGWQWVQRIF